MTPRARRVRREYKYSIHFPLMAGSREALSKRINEAKDIVRRIGVIPPHRVFINNYPVNFPPAIFNPSLFREEDVLKVYARIIVGYYKYVSGIVEITVPLEDIETGSVSLNYYSSRIVVFPSTRYDLWGAEDPRVYSIDGERFMTYTGRTINYFNPSVRIERTLPVTAVWRPDEDRWIKRYVHILPDPLENELVSNKDAFIASARGRKFFFHRPHMIDENYYMLIGVEGERVQSDGVEEVVVENNREAMRPAHWEDKLGWSAPPIVLGGKIIAFIHGVDREVGAYKVFAAEIDVDGEEPVISAVTPSYIMAPSKPYEVFGDRPYTIFPCGTTLIGDRLIITYGAGDSMIGFGEINLDELLGLLDKGRIF